MSLINFIIVVLFIIYIVCAWNSTKEFENTLMRISFILVGTLFITLLTLILFWISKIGVQYPKKEMIGEVRRIILLSFIPINGFITLTQSASIFAQAKSGMVSKEEVDNLMNELLKLPNPFSCPHGRPTVMKMSKYDIERKFERK